MAISRAAGGFLLALICGNVFAAAPVVDAPLPLLSVSERGELAMAGDDFKFVPWRSDTFQGKVQVIQYISGTMEGSKTFRPFTVQLEKTFKPDVVHLTSVVNLEAAIWGTSGFVVAELEKSKRWYPTSTMVVDDKGSGVAEWELGEAGSGLIITDAKGIVKYFSRQALSEAEIATALALVKSNTDAAGAAAEPNTLSAK